MFVKHFKYCKNLTCYANIKIIMFTDKAPALYTIGIDIRTYLRISFYQFLRFVENDAPLGCKITRKIGIVWIHCWEHTAVSIC